MALLGNNSFDIGNSKLNYTYSMNLLIDLFFLNDFTFTLEKKISKKISNRVSNLWSWPKSSKKRTSIMFLKLFLNEMIKNINIPNILDIIEISKSIKPNKCTH